MSYLACGSRDPLLLFECSSIQREKGLSSLAPFWFFNQCRAADNSVPIHLSGCSLSIRLSMRCVNRSISSDKRSASPTSTSAVLLKDSSSTCFRMEPNTVLCSPYCISLVLVVLYLFDDSPIILAQRNIEFSYDYLNWAGHDEQC